MQHIDLNTILDITTPLRISTCLVIIIFMPGRLLPSPLLLMPLLALFGYHFSTPVYFDAVKEYLVLWFSDQNAVRRKLRCHPENHLKACPTIVFKELVFFFF